jgi:hypothetical protein
MAVGAALALLVAVGTALLLLLLEGPEMQAAALRTWPMWTPALAGPAVLGALGALLIALTAVRGHGSRQKP